MPPLLWLLVAGALFMEMLDGTVIATALPQIAGSFGVAPVDLSIGMTAYLVTAAAFIPVSGYLADRFSLRRVFTAAIVAFTIASVLCALARTLPQFIVARVLQGIAGAMMAPVGRLAVLRGTQKHELIRAISIMTWPALIAPVVGPPIGGFITTFASWRWIFLLNVPAGVIGAWLAWARVSPARGAPRPFDATGFVLTTGALAALLAGLDLAARPGPLGWVLLAIGLATGAAAVRHASTAPHPMLDLAARRIPTFAYAVLWGVSAFRIAVSAVPFLAPYMLQVGFGLSAFDAGLLLLAAAAGNLVMKSITTPILNHFAFRRVLIGNGVIAAASIAACGLIGPDTAAAVILVIYFIQGASRSMQFSAINTLGFADVPPTQTSAANAVSAMLNQMNTGMGVAFGALMLHAASLLWPAGTPQFHATIALAAAGLLCALSLPGALALPGDAGGSLRRAGK